MSGERILLVDDDKGIRESCGKAIRTAGYDLKVASSGEEAMEILKEFDAELLITDLQMGGMSGMDLLKYVRVKRPECEVIIITSYPSADTAIEALRMGVADYIKKPFGVNDLRNVIKKVFAIKDEDKAIKKGRKVEEEEEIYTSYEVSKFCGVSLTTVANWIDAGMLKAHRTPGGHRRILRKDLLDFIKTNNMHVPDKLKDE
ncbi:MAG: response regulator [Elusimicrobia bacterium]|nr:response regulator [Elusimicrobiota bacterium]